MQYERDATNSFGKTNQYFQDAPLANALAPAKFPLIRPYHGRVFAGVCRGISLHLGIPVWIVRVIFFVGLFTGLGLLAYIFLWITVPAADARIVQAQNAHQAQFSASQAPLSYGNAPFNTMPAPMPNNDSPASCSAGSSYVAPPKHYDSTPLSATANIPRSIAQTLSTAYTPQTQWEETARRTQPYPTSSDSYTPQPARTSILNLIGLITAGLIIIYVAIVFAVNRSYIPDLAAAALMVSAIIVMIEWTFFERFHVNKLVIAFASLGVFLVAVMAILWHRFGVSDDFAMHLWFIAIAMATVALIAAPWLADSNRNLAAQTAQKEREAERADMAAHLHDSVLQTLNLIRQNADDAQTVSRLARTQERELRRWLYEDRESATQSLVSSMKLMSAQVEDTFGKEIDVVTVGDALPGEKTQALVEATKQALTNACVHGGEPISLYVEARPDALEVFVRDHGEGFNPDDVPADRMGIRHSIRGRLERAGGTVSIVSRPSWGTEVRMKLPVASNSYSAKEGIDSDGVQR